MIRAIGSTALFLLATIDGGETEVVEPVRLSATIEGHRTVIEVRDQSRPDAQESIRSAFEAMADTLRSLDGDSPEGELASLNSAAGQGPRLIGEELLATLQKTLGFCLWSRGAQGPLGARLYGTWETSSSTPTPEELREATQTANCQNLQLRPETLQASLAAGCRLDLRHFADGIAIDRAVDRLLELGARNLWVERGPTVRALGPGADGQGWRYAPPRFAGMSEGLEPMRLRDMSLAAVSAHRDRFRFGELSYPPFLDQRTGQPASGVVAVLVATPQATDALALATTMMILGNREGQLRLANVTPAPSALWLLGDGSGEPLLNTYKWTALGIP